ncbi:MAG: hypothetical protein KatS3mg119_0207 [Rhodothalassiaceae bacterium]|nr:MAG: hypothetical protein KatS3mg119_0207 [Rhodothalassiaceae bacterium]
MSGGCDRLEPLYRPRSVAVLGASARPTSSGGAVVRMMRKAGYAGRIVPVNPKGGAIEGLPAVPGLDALDGPVDLVVVAIRPDAILEAVEAAARLGNRHFLVLPGGFREAGPQGVAREEALAELARRFGLLVAGPNCGGLIRLDAKTRLAATFFRDLPPGGGVAFVSQSGALAEEMIAHAVATSAPLGTVVSVGNALQLGIAEHLEFLAADSATTAILLYFESVADEEAFIRAARRAARRKPVVALIPGRRRPGRGAAAAHTGAAFADERTIRRLAARAGLLRVADLRELQIAMRAFGRFPPGIGERVLILSNSGGPGVLCTDRAALMGLKLRALPRAMARELRALLPGECAVRNPLDILADAREDRFAACFDAAVRHSRAFDAVLMIHVVPFMVDAGPVVACLAERARAAPWPVMHAMMGTLEHKAAWFAVLEQAGVLTFDSVEDMATAAGLLARYRRIRASLGGADEKPARPL